MNGELKRLRAVERWIGGIRLVAVPFAVFQVAITSGYPSGYEVWAWVTTGLFAVGALVLFRLGRRDWPRAAQHRLGAAALAFDFAAVSAYILIFSFEDASPVRQVMYLPLIEAALRYGIWGAVAVVVASAPVMAVFEWLREHHSDPRSYQDRLRHASARARALDGSDRRLARTRLPRARRAWPRSAQARRSDSVTSSDGGPTRSRPPTGVPEP